MSPMFIVFLVLVAALAVCYILLGLYRAGKWKPKVKLAEAQKEDTEELSALIHAFNEEFGTEDLEELGVRVGDDPLPDVSEDPA